VTSPRRYRVTQRDGRVVVGAVRGVGGMLAGSDSYERLCAASVRASIGKPMRSITEAAPGFCLMYPDYSRHADGDVVEVDLRHATVEAAS
jgi:hypothetical protein